MDNRFYKSAWRGRLAARQARRAIHSRFLPGHAAPPRRRPVPSLPMHLLNLAAQRRPGGLLPSPLLSQRSLPPMRLALLAWGLLQVGMVHAQDPALDAPIRLRPSTQLSETIAKTQRSQLPSFVTGDRISGRPDLETVIEGNAVLRRGDTIISADRLEYYQPDDRAKASGNVRINQAGNVYEGPELELKLETFEGFFNRVRYEFLATGGQGDAQRIDFVDENRSVARLATYTTCRREDDPGWLPSWILSASIIRTDTEENVGVAENAQMRFMGITTPALPSISFPLNSDRKSGFLPPTLGIDNVNGAEITQPYYWNIAPNRDLTVSPTVMSKRGVNLGTEFRYLEQGYGGEVRADYMPTDSLRNRQRWGIWAKHRQGLPAAELGFDSLSANLDINRVSDDDYWRDFSRTPSLTGRLLANDGSIDWSKGDFSGRIRALSYQTLQYEPSPIVPTYDRMPQITAGYNKYDWNGFDLGINTDFTHFRTRRIRYGEPGFDLGQQSQPEGDRAFAVATLSRPFVTPATFVIPKVQVHATRYNYFVPQADLAKVTLNGQSFVNGIPYDPNSPQLVPTSTSRVVPTFSLDSGVVFERDASFFGRAFRQTLEPRAFYVYTPYRDQNRLPNYDSASNDFNFATVYTENSFSGNDRIADNNLLTLGTTTRLIDPDTGAEAARFGIAQRLRFSDQRVTLPGLEPISDRVSDVLAGAQINWSPKWSFDTTVQYNPDTNRSARNTVGVRYSPGPYRTVSAAYRYQDDKLTTVENGSKSIDVGWQWPLNDLWGDKGQDLGPGRGQGGNRWYAVGRLNYSLRDRRMTDAVVGLEYDGCCYVGRIVLEQLSTGQASTTRRIMFQLEFVGFSAVGSSPLRTLQVNVPNYQKLRSPTLAPSRFTNYD
ncbi:MAG: LPS-assembly protein LptD [Comamonadaceae bacterium]|nr:MAG: LPS-assembly protein LptD [Comamonadaceae bacterium]